MDHGRHRHHPAGWAEPRQSHLVGGVTYTPASKSKDDQVKAAFVLAPGASYPQDEHRTGILLVDPAANEIVFLDYFPNLSSQADASGSLASVSLRLPAGIRIPAAVRVYIILDVYPAAERTFGN